MQGSMNQGCSKAGLRTPTGAPYAFHPQVPHSPGSDSEDEPAAHSSPYIPQLCHTISVKGRTAFATRAAAPGAAAAAPPPPLHVPGTAEPPPPAATLATRAAAPGVAAAAPPPHAPVTAELPYGVTSPAARAADPAAAQPAYPALPSQGMQPPPRPASPPAANHAKVPQHHSGTHTAAAADMQPDSLSSSPNRSRGSSSSPSAQTSAAQTTEQMKQGGSVHFIPRSVHQASPEHSHRAHAGKWQELSASGMGGSSNRSMSSSMSSMSGSARAKGLAKGVFEIGGRCFNARGEEVAPPLGTYTASSAPLGAATSSPALHAEHSRQQQAEAGVALQR